MRKGFDLRWSLYLGLATLLRLAEKWLVYIVLTEKKIRVRFWVLIVRLFHMNYLTLRKCAAGARVP